MQFFEANSRITLMSLGLNALPSNRILSCSIYSIVMTDGNISTA